MPDLSHHRQIQMETDGEADSEEQAGVSCVVQGATENIPGSKSPAPSRTRERAKSSSITGDANMKTKSERNK